jgi:hypothetical protein
MFNKRFVIEAEYEVRDDRQLDVTLRSILRAQVHAVSAFKSYRVTAVKWIILFIE